jgi:hypothetical protein
MQDNDEFGQDRGRLQEFRIAVRKQFGRNLEKATPSNVREFMDRYQEEVFQNSFAKEKRIELNETKTTYEEILKDFFVKVLDHPTEEALIMLWTLAFDLSFFNIEQHAAQRLHSLFGDTQDPS